MRFIAGALLAVFLMVLPAEAQLPALPTAPAEEPAPTPAVDDLIRILENDAARSELIQRLRAQTDGSADAADAETAAPDDTFARRIADYTRNIADGVSATVTSTVQIVTNLDEVLTAQGRDIGSLTRILGNVVILAIALFASFFVLRRIVARLQTGISNQVAGRGWISRIMGMIAAFAIDAASVAAAWAIGYAVSLSFLPDAAGRMSLNQSLLLNAFLTVEMTKVFVRAVFEPHGRALRPLPVGDTTAAYWYFWFARIIGLIGYSFMFFAPALAEYVNPSLAQGVRVIAMIAAVTVAILIVLQNKHSVRAAMLARAKAGRQDALSKALAFLASYWHMIAIGYAVAVLVAWLVRPDEAVPFMLAATLQSAIAIVVGMALVSFVSRVVSVGVRLPKDIKDRLPLLEARLHAFVPHTMQIVRTVTLIGVVIAIAQAWGLIDFFSWIASETGQRVTGSVISAGIIVLVGFLVYLAMSSWVEYRLNPNFGTVPTAREKTLLSLFRNAVTIAIAVFATMLALAQIGINIAPLLAGAGVLAFAIGFGAQKFVQDIITGVFIQLENIMNEGDVVETGGIFGTVEKLTIRSVSIRTLDGTLHLIPFSSVDMVSNAMKGFAFHVANVPVAYDSDLEEVKEAMHEAFDELMQTDAKTSILEPLEMHGATELADSAIIMRARIKTMPGMQWAIGRQYNEFIKSAFQSRGIEIPFPQVTYHLGVQGQTEALASPKKRRKKAAREEARPVIEATKAEPSEV